MPSSVNDLLKDVNIPLAGVTLWGGLVNTNKSGVYLVSLSTTLDDKKECLLDSAPLSLETIQSWIDRVPDMTVDGVRPTAKTLANRLASFWLPDEPMLYIGKATKLGQRIKQYYRTPLGDRRPHAGGHWLKTLSVLGRLYVYWAEVDNPAATEGLLINAFVRNVSSSTRNKLFDPFHPYPFANRQDGDQVRKKHGINNSVLRN